MSDAGSEKEVIREAGGGPKLGGVTPIGRSPVKDYIPIYRGRLGAGGD